MKHYGILILLLIGVVLFVIPAQAATIIFDEVPAGTLLSNDANHPYDDLYGVHFSEISSGANETTYAGGSWGRTGTNGPNFYGFDGPGVASAGYARGIIITFDEDVTAISFDYALGSLSMPRTIRYYAYDDGEQVGTGTISPTSSWKTLSYEGTFDSFKVQMQNCGSGTRDRWVMDNLTFAQVPIPGSLLLLASGLAGILRMRGKRRA